jgi:hypothetical protein
MFPEGFWRLATVIDARMHASDRPEVRVRRFGS